MSVSRHPSIRALLRSCDDGMTLPAIAQALNAPEDPVRLALRNMPDAYIDRWVKTKSCRGQCIAVWCVVVPPENCPRPSDV